MAKALRESLHIFRRAFRFQFVQKKNYSSEKCLNKQPTQGDTNNIGVFVCCAVRALD
jgi:hypothetical protein